MDYRSEAKSSGETCEFAADILESLSVEIHEIDFVNGNDGVLIPNNEQIIA